MQLVTLRVARYNVPMKSAALLLLLAALLGWTGCTSPASAAKHYKQSYSSFDQPSDHATNGVTPAGGGVIPAGCINFLGADVSQVLEIYAKVANRTLLCGRLPGVQIVCKNNKPMNAVELLQMFDTVLAANGVVIIYSGENSIKAVPLNQLQGEVFPEIDLPWPQLPLSASPMQRKVWLKKLKPSTLIPVLAPLSNLPGSLLAVDDEHLLILRDYSKNVREQLKLIEELEQQAK